MDKNKYISYFQDETVIKFGSLRGEYFLNAENDIVIFFAFFHEGLKAYSPMANDQRIFLKVDRAGLYEGLNPLKSIGLTTLFLVNSENSDFAILFKVSIDSKDNTVRLEMLEQPKLGSLRVTEYERNGVTIKY